MIALMQKKRRPSTPPQDSAAEKDSKLNSTHEQSLVKVVENDLLSELERFVRIPPSMQAAFWVACLSGATSSKGWEAPKDELLRTYLKYGWEGESPEHLGKALEELYTRGWLDCRTSEDIPTYRISTNTAFFNVIRIVEMSTASISAMNIKVDMQIKFNVNQIWKDLKEFMRRNKDKPNAKESVLALFHSIFLVIAHENTPKKEEIQTGQLLLEGIGVQGLVKTSSPRQITDKLVKFWAQRSGRKNARTIERRIRMVEKRIGEGYEIEDLYQAIAGVCYSPFHKEKGHDTFEVALRNGEQVEKGKAYWLTYAPIEFIEVYQKRTGRPVPAREEELVQRQSQRKREADQYARLQKVLEEKRERERDLAEREKIDRELMEIYMPSNTLEEHKARLSESDKSQFTKEANNGQ